MSKQPPWVWPAFRKHNEPLPVEGRRTRQTESLGVDIDRVHFARQSPLPSISDRPAHKGYPYPEKFQRYRP